MDQAKVETELSTQQKIDLARYSLSHLSDLIRFADQKALFLMAVIGFLAGHLLSKSAQIQKTNSWVVIVLEIFAVLTTLLALGYAWKVVYPRTTRKEVAKGFIYWANVLQYNSYQEFVQGFSNFTVKDVLDNFTEQIYIVSKINENKYNNLKCCFVFAVLSVIWNIILMFMLP